MFSSITHKIVPRPRFVRVLDCDRILVVRTLKLCPIMCRSRTKLCPNFGCSRARLCPISFAPCHFLNLAATLLNGFHIDFFLYCYRACRPHVKLLYSYSRAVLRTGRTGQLPQGPALRRAPALGVIFVN